MATSQLAESLSNLADDLEKSRERQEEKGSSHITLWIDDVRKNAIEFERIGNYRGNLMAAEINGKYYWMVDCNVERTLTRTLTWTEIPAYLWESLVKHHKELEDGYDPEEHYERED